MTKKGLNFFMGPEAIAAFNRLKKLFTTALILVIFDPEREIVIETDALRFAIIVVLSQPNESKKLRPVAYFSRKILGPERNYEIHNMELLAVVEAFRE